MLSGQEVGYECKYYFFGKKVFIHFECAVVNLFAKLKTN